MKLSPYLHYKDTCEEAFEFYEKATGGKIIERHRFKDMPPQEGGGGGDGCGEPSADAMKAMAEKIMHIRLELPGGDWLMGSDAPPQFQNDAGFQGFTVALGFPDVGPAKKVFDALAEGGTVTMPFQETFWTEGFGMLNDRFGVAWMVNAGEKPST